MRSSITHIGKDDSIDFLVILRRLLHYWKWYLIILVSSFLLGLVFLWVNRGDDSAGYQSTSLFLVEDIRYERFNPSLMREMEYFKETLSKEDVSEILTSSLLMAKVVDSLNLHVLAGSYPLNYKNTGYSIAVNGEVKRNYELLLSNLGNDRFLLTIGSKEYRGQFGEDLELGEFTINIRTSGESEDIGFTVMKLQDQSTNWAGKIRTKLTSKVGNIIELSIATEEKALGVDILNVLMEKFLETRREDRKAKAFELRRQIDKKLLDVVSLLNQSENRAEEFRMTNSFLDLDFEGRSIYGQLKNIEDKIYDKESEIQYYTYVSKVILESRTSIVTPPGNAMAGNQLSSLVLAYNDLSNELISLESTVSESSTQVRTLQAQMENIVQAIRNNVIDLQRIAERELEQLRSSAADYRKELAKIPENEKKYLEIQRELELREKLYNYLIERRSEADLANALAYQLPFSIVDYAKSKKMRNGTSKVLFYLLGLFALLFPAFVLLIYDVSMGLISDPNRLERYGLKVRVIIPKRRSTHLDASISQLISLLFHYSRTDKNTTPFRVLIASENVEENKTFVAFELAKKLTTAGKKVLMILPDPGLNKNLVNDEIPVHHYDGDQLVNDPNNIVPSGTYDYIIYVSRPIAKYGDHYSISHEIDLTYFIIKHRRSTEEGLKKLIQLDGEGVFKNLQVVYSY